MAEMIAGMTESESLESTTVGIYRTAAVVKGGRRFSFSALVVVGDRHGRVGIGYGKAPGVPAAIEKAQKDARKKLLSVELAGGTLPHPVMAKFGASQVRLIPAAPGTGVIAGATVRAVLELAGVRDCLSKAYGSTNQKNLCKAAFKGLTTLRGKAVVEQLRGVTLEKTDVELRLEAGEKHVPAAKTAAAAGPVNKLSRQGRSGGPRRGGRDGGRSGGPRQGSGGHGPRQPKSQGPQEEGSVPEAQAPAAEPANPPQPPSEQPTQEQK